MDGTAIIVSPLIALMKDQADGLMAKGIPSAFINRSMIPEGIPAVEAHILEWRVTASRPKV
jgi:superfamily II DNA helicase RecQ